MQTILIFEHTKLSSFNKDILIYKDDPCSRTSSPTDKIPTEI